MSTITLAVCARDAQDIISDCLSSIKHQTVAPDEVIVAVHEWSDQTVTVAKEWGAKVIAHHGTGLFEARNAVLAECTTDYLAFTDADCVLTPQWVERVKRVFDTHPEVAAGTGRHPAIGKPTFASWLHHMWFLVETCQTGLTDGVIGGNSYFRVKALRNVGGWLNLPGHSNAEDVYISIALQRAGYGIWFEEGAAAQHKYEASFRALMSKSVRMGRGIVVMMRAAGIRNGLWWYTLMIPMLAAMLPVGVVTALFINAKYGIGIVIFPLLLTFLYLAMSFGSVGAALPRWFARWIVIWPYSWGIVRGLADRLPDRPR